MAVLPLTGKPVLIRSSEKAVIHSLDSVWLSGSDISFGQDANSGENQPRETRNDHRFCKILTILLTLAKYKFL